MTTPNNLTNTSPGLRRGWLPVGAPDEFPVDVVVPHQASAVGLAFLRKQLARRAGAPPVVDILAEAGNQVSVSIPHALHRAIADGALRRGQSALLVGTAAGVSLNGIVLRY